MLGGRSGYRRTDGRGAFGHRRRDPLGLPRQRRPGCPADAAAARPGRAGRLPGPGAIPAQAWFGAARRPRTPATGPRTLARTCPLHHKHPENTPCTGRELHGVVRTTILRGQVIDPARPRGVLLHLRRPPHPPRPGPHHGRRLGGLSRVRLIGTVTRRPAVPPATAGSTPCPPPRRSRPAPGRPAPGRATELAARRPLAEDDTAAGDPALTSLLDGEAR